MSDELTTYQRLAAPFDVSDHAKVPKGGMTQTYAPWTAYVERLNAVLPNLWSFRVIREGFTETECWVLGEITAVIDGETVTRQQYGCEPILKGSRPASDLLKSVASDAVKKAASLIGVGLYLSVKEEREAVEAAMQEAIRQAVQEKRGGSPKPPANPAPPPPTDFGAPPASDLPPLKTKVEMVADLQKGMEFARSLGLDPAEPDPTRMNRADLEDVILALRSQCRAVLAERKQQTAS